MSTAARIAATFARRLAAALVALAAAPAGIGILYLLRAERLFASDTRLRGALPLQQLAGDAAQPRLRVVVAFLSAGLAAGLALGLLTRARSLAIGLSAGVLAWAVLVATGAVSDAVASALRVAPRLRLQLSHRGLWAESASIAAGLLLGAWAARRARVRHAAATPAGHPAWAHARAARIVAAHGRDALDPFALRDDTSFHFAADGLLAYRVLGRTAVVSGDPIAPPGRASELFEDFAAYAAERGWSVTATGVSPGGLRELDGCGYRALQIGAEAIVDPRTFTLEGRTIRKVRQAVARVERAGWRVEARPAAELDALAVVELEELDARWRARQPRVCGFAMTLGRLWGAPEDDDALYVLARDPGGELAAFLRFARYAGGGALSLDVTRRGVVEEPNGVAEAMVVAALRHAADAGVAEVSLNFAGFAHVMAVDPATLTRRRRALRWLLMRLHGRFQLERLARFNEKFFPTWRPRYLLYRSRRNLPLAALRVLQAEAYVRPPAERRLPQRWQPAGRPVGAAAALTAAAPPPSVAAPGLPRAPILAGARGR